MNPRVAIIILNYNGKIDTLECLESIFRISYSNFRVILVDNNSQDGTVEAVRKKFGRRLKIIQNDRNLGFAEGNNVGIRAALKMDVDFILILNNDTVVNPNFLDILLKNVQAHPDFAVFSPQIRKYPEKNKIWYAGGRMLWPVASVQMFNRGHLMSQTKLKKPTQVSFVTGAAMMVKSSVFKKVGFFDKKFYLYWEETDWEARAARVGVKFLYVPDAVIWHKVGKTSGGPQNPKMQYYFWRNNLLFARKNLPIWLWPSFLLFYFSRILFIEILWRSLKYLAGETKKLDHIKYIFLGISDFFAGKFGPKKFDPKT